MRPVDVNVHRREAVLETFSYETLRGQVIALIKLSTTDYAEDARIAFQTSRVNLNSIHQMQNASEMAFRIFEGNAARNPMHLVSQRQKIVCKITSVLAGYSGNECAL